MTKIAAISLARACGKEHLASHLGEWAYVTPVVAKLVGERLNGR